MDNFHLNSFYIKETILWIIVITVISFSLYAGIATKVFMYKHPKTNDMIFWHEPKAVLTFQTLEKYQ